METATFKERFINFCRNKKVQITFIIIYCIFAIFTLLSAFDIIFKSISSFFILFTILYIFTDTIIGIISKEDDYVLNNNKLLNIILANKNTWNWIIFFPLFYILILILSLFNISGILQNICLIILFIGSCILSLKLANLISKKFKDKLVYKTDSNL